jgi:hypothetical protein
MNELQFANKIRQVLDESARVDAQTAERLRAARERALANQRMETGFRHAWADNVTGRLGGVGLLSVRVLVPALVLALSLVAIQRWQDSQRAAEVEEIDALLLSEDLPIDAYLDRGFEAWLKRRG